MNTTSLDERADEKHTYLAQLRHELSVLPPESRDDILRDVGDHLEDTRDDARPMSETVGTPREIALAALEERKIKVGRPVPPHHTMLSKRLQLVVAALAVLANVVFAVRIGGWFPFGYAGGLLQFVPVLLVAIPPLLVRWTRWWTVSLLCTIVYAAYLLAALLCVTVYLAAPLLAIHFLASWPILLLTQGPLLALLIIALVRAPGILRAR
ncbi:MAG: hypothetical protein JWQ43_3677 [Glaciihabitans sp.]|nr:hypothetical protein [Glaciihabitans sp.]